MSPEGDDNVSVDILRDVENRHESHIDVDFDVEIANNVARGCDPINATKAETEAEAEGETGAGA